MSSNLIRHSDSFLSNWEQTQKVFQKIMTQEFRQWGKLEGGRLKCNMDASVLHNVSKTSYGEMVQNSQGAFVVGLTGYFEYILDLTLA